MYKTYFQFSVAATSLFIGLNLIGAKPAQAIINTYDFDVTTDSGSLTGNTYSGSFSYDDSVLTGSGDEYPLVSDLDFNFLGTNYTEADALATPEAYFFDGNFLGLDYSTNAQFSFVSGFDFLSEASFAYDVSGPTGAGTGNISYSAATPTPVPFGTDSTKGILLLGSLFIAKKAIAHRRASSK